MNLSLRLALRWLFAAGIALLSFIPALGGTRGVSQILLPADALKG